MKIQDIKISKKLPAIMVFIAIIAALTTGLFSLKVAEDAMTHEAQKKLVALQAARESTLELYLSSIEQDLQILSHNLMVKEAVLDFLQGWNSITLIRL